MAFYSTQCAACADATKRSVERQNLEMYECQNETCKLYAAREKGIKQLQTLQAEVKPASQGTREGRRGDSPRSWHGMRNGNRHDRRRS